ncbi:Glycosyltransferase (plasmid) [Sinorhizobium sojae CCBAU 05684]|uniref:Glycosyltransferase n=1 Tax=Sinorhizobium sojae CCBAU 05684 TaxID=716928 RepID=A0A249PJG8_9HYPH|nr:glycosyltransferase family 4 protein [Sinorhizobium sojae]ASY66061.1 Glycosyltransferase [Sinorhizobium sojae CCBAU 05684]
MSNRAASPRPATAGVNARTKVPRRILMSIDAVGGIWRYAMDLAQGIRESGIETVFVGYGPAPSASQRREANRIGVLEWLSVSPDWMADDEAGLDSIADRLTELSLKHAVELLHLNLPSQAVGLQLQIPIVVVSHSCVTTWFEAVRGSGLPEHWLWQKTRNRRGFDRADLVLAPSRSHAAALTRCYGQIDDLMVVHNASRSPCPRPVKECFVFAAGRWWDEGKNGVALDRAAARFRWPVAMAGACEGPCGERLAIEHAEHLGELSHDRTMALMSRAAIVVSPSLYEPFGLAALEAARSGAALVLSDIDTYRELWDGAALFADPRDPAAFAGSLERLARDTDLRAELGQSARLRSSEFTVEAQRDAMLDVYGRAMRASGRLTAAE